MNIAELFGLKNQFVIVTGAGGGLGSELARILAEAHAHVVLVDCNSHAIEELATEFQSQGHSVSTLS